MHPEDCIANRASLCSIEIPASSEFTLLPKIRTLVLPGVFFCLLAIGVMGAGGIARAEARYSFNSTPGRLPKDVVPMHYKIDLKPDLTKLRVAGSETIDIKVIKPTNQVVLNAVDMTIDSASLKGESGQVAALNTRPKSEMVTLAFPRPLAAGAHTLIIAFTGHINGFGRGLFHVDYPTAEGRKRMIATELEPADARRVFPCWDEPSFKASFEPSVVVRRDFMAVSNMPIVHEEPLGDDLKRVSFGATPPMSTYLFVLVAGELDRLQGESDGVKVGVVAVRGKSAQGRYALTSAIDLLRYYNSYFGIKYPLPKLDLIAVPSAVGGAMENWGGIVFNERILLFDPGSSPDSLRRSIFGVLAHEMAHQWFGDLVTMAWWNDLWLNEGFASWMQNKAADALHPEWHVWLNSMGSKERAMDIDARQTSHPIQQPVADESEAQSVFDSITYSKSQAFLRELENYLGAEKFRDGIRRYMRAHKYSNATTADLWEALHQASGEDVAAIAAPYTEHPGVPLVMSRAACSQDGQHLTLTQERFLRRPAKVNAEVWEIPIVFGPPDAKAPTGRVLMREKTIHVDAGRCGMPIKLNFGDTGYYRVEYDPGTDAALAKAIETMAPADRVNLLSDNWALFEAGRIAVNRYFRLVDNVEPDRNRAVWERVLAVIGRVDDLERGMPGRPAFQAYARARLRPPFERLGWNRAPGESEDQTILRARLIGQLGALGDSAIIAEAKRRFAAFTKNEKSLDVNLRGTVIFLAGRYADTATWDEIRTLGRKATSTENRVRYYIALAAAINPELEKRALAITLTNEVPPDLASGMIMEVAAGDHPQLALDFVKAHFDALTEKRGPYFRSFFMSSLMTNFADRAHAEELAKFGPVHQTAGGRIAAARAEEEIIDAADFREHQIPEIDAWVKQHPSPAKTSPPD
jgi:aminopeptidase N